MTIEYIKLQALETYLICRLRDIRDAQKQLDKERLELHYKLLQTQLEMLKLSRMSRKDSE
jgi:hypothetical protein